MVCSATITTTNAWPTGVYIVRLVRNDNRAENEILFVVRDDARASPLLYGIPFSTYEAYNNYGGKSFYGYNSTGSNTVAGTPQAVKVSFDRPFEQARTAATTNFHDWYTRTDYAAVYWLERSGYDVAYQSNTDMELNGARVKNHQAYVLGAHDEYYSAAMRTALESARDAGIDLFVPGANGVYWKIRYENGPNGGQNRIEVCYKTSATGVQDPSGPTGAWRDPNGANKPENALLGVMYVGDNSSAFFPLTVRSAEGSDKDYRYTGLQGQPSGSSINIGASIVGWEWDACRQRLRANRCEDAVELRRLQARSRTTAATTSSPRRLRTRPCTRPPAATGLRDRDESVDTGPRPGWRRRRKPDLRIQQTTTNVLEDMGVLPSTPSRRDVLDNLATRGCLTSPADTGGNVAVAANVRDVQGGMDASTISSSFTLTDSDGLPMTGSPYNARPRESRHSTRRSAAAASIQRAARPSIGIWGDGLPYAYTWSFTTAAALRPLLDARPADQPVDHGTARLGVRSG